MSIPPLYFPSIPFNFFSATSAEAKRWNSKINTNLFSSFFGCEITGSILSVLVFGYTVKLYYLPPVRVSEWMDCLKVVN